MFEIVSFIFGGLFRIAPKLIEMREKERDREHERLMLDLQMKADEQRAKLEVQKMEVSSELQQQLAELQALITAGQATAKSYQKTGNPWMDIPMVLVEVANGAVRPVLTYWYCVAAYGAYKAALYFILLEQETGWKDAILQLWTPNDHAVMFSIIGFWFVDRAIRKREQGS
jgi:hypothetical protein